jgi:hypothetical protein
MKRAGRGRDADIYTDIKGRERLVNADGGRWDTCWMENGFRCCTWSELDPHPVPVFGFALGTAVHVARSLRARYLSPFSHSYSPYTTTRGLHVGRQSSNLREDETAREAKTAPVRWDFSFLFVVDSYNLHKLQVV